MKTRAFLFLLSFTCFIHFNSYAQETETVVSGGVTNNISGTSTGMYGGTESDAAREFYIQAADYASKQDFTNAKKYYLKAIKKDPNFVEAYDNLGRVYRRIGDYDNAIKYYKKSIELYPEGMMAHQNLAVVYGILKNEKGAIEEYNTLIKLSPRSPEGYFGLANTYMMMGKFDVALENAEKALKIYEETNSHYLSDGYQMMGYIHYYDGDKDNAKKYFKQAKEHGGKLSPEVQKELFPNEEEEKEEEGIRLETPEDYAKLEPIVIKAFDWLMANPADQEVEQRKAFGAFLIQWLTGAPNVSIALSEKIISYSNCDECLIIFMGGWAKYALESKDFDNPFKGNLAGTESIIEFYQKNKKALGKNQAIQKLMQLQEDGELKSYIKSNM